MSRLTDIADGVVSAINAASLPVAVVSSRRWLVELRLEELSTLRVDVVPRTIERSAHTRTASAQECTVMVVVQKVVGTSAGGIVDADVDALASLAEAIANLLDVRTIANAAFLRMVHDPVASTELLNEHHLFRSVIAVTYRAMP